MRTDRRTAIRMLGVGVAAAAVPLGGGLSGPEEASASVPTPVPSPAPSPGATPPATTPSPAPAVPGFTLPPLGYAYEALEPHIDAETMKIHHGTHHKAYVDRLNNELKEYPRLLTFPIEKLVRNLHRLPRGARLVVKEAGGGHYLHSLFWESLAPGGEKAPSGRTAEMLAKLMPAGGTATADEKLADLFVAPARRLFGSGWVTLYAVGREGHLTIGTDPNQTVEGRRTFTPILGIDVWEHAYYLKYRAARAEYVKNVLKVVNWTVVGKRYEAHLKKFGR